MSFFVNVFDELGLDFDLPFASFLTDVDMFYSLCDPGECSVLLILILVFFFFFFFLG